MAELNNYKDEIAKALLEKKAVLGAKITLKLLRKHQLTKIYLAANAASVYEEDIRYYAQISGVTVEKLPLTAEEMGILCKKPFFISVLSIS